MGSNLFEYLNASPAWRESNGFGRTAIALTPATGEAQWMHDTACQYASAHRPAMKCHKMTTTQICQRGERKRAARFGT